MPTLDWIGKKKIVNHHLEVPFHVLERKYSYDENGQHDEDNGSENMIIHGDNLLALKSLLPKYEAAINCIYIDPPYNTGEEGWVYNDNVNDPQLLEWLGNVVGKEGEDLSRHDKWICMIYPRLKLLQKLLANDGVIFISIDNNELSNLWKICDEIFGANCFVSCVSWQRTYSPRNDSKGVSSEVESILVYSKSPGWQPKRLPRTEKMNSVYKNPDNDVTLWRNSDAFAPSASTHQGMVYAIQHPITGELIYPYDGACWPLEQSSMLYEMRKWANYELKDIGDDKKRADVCGVGIDDIRKEVKAIMLTESLESAKTKALEIYQKGPWPRFFFTKGGYGGIARKTYLDDAKGKTVTNFWPYDEVGHTDEAKKEIKAIFGDKKAFDTPKPTRLIERIIQIATGSDDIVLDSFAGSGTTGHAVLNLNKKTGSNRSFIEIELGDYAETVTAERAKRVIKGYSHKEEIVLFEEEISLSNLKNGEALLEEATAVYTEEKGRYDKIKKPKIENGCIRVVAENKASTHQKGTGGNFSYYELGEQLMIDENINEMIDIEKIREYIYFTETKSQMNAVNPEEPHCLGIHYSTAYYFFYEKDIVTTLNREFMHTIKTIADSYVIYADLCTLSDNELEKYNITFKKIPRDITRL